MIITTKYENAYKWRKKIREEFFERVNKNQAKFNKIHQKLKKIMNLSFLKIFNNTKILKELIKELKK